MLVAVLTLDTFNRQADKLLVANIAQPVNDLQAIIPTRDEKMVPRQPITFLKCIAPASAANVSRARSTHRQS
jgi:alpha-L-arabinofuranosidase